MIQLFLEKITLNRALIVLGAVALVLGATAFVVVFYGGGTYVVNSPLPTGTSALNATTTASSTATTTAFLDNGNGNETSSTTASSSPSSGGSGTATLADYSSTYSTPPISWLEGYDTIAITGADLSGSRLTLTVSVNMGAVAECVPMNMRLVANEKGDLTAPLTTAFTFGENGTCIGLPAQTYTGQQIVFTVDPSTLPLLFTTGGSSNQYFELSTTPAGGITITPPPTQG